MKKEKSLFRKRKFYYTLALFLVIAANVNAVFIPVYAKVEYLWSRQQSIVSKFGRWDIVSRDSPVNSVHAALLRTGKVLIIAGSGNNETAFKANSFKTVIWDPLTGNFTDVPTPWDAFCSGHAFLPDGKLLVAGGTKGYEDLTKTPRQNYSGLKDSYLFDPGTERYEKVSDLNYARWYPTLVGLGNGSVLAAGGLDEKGNMSQGQTEIYDQNTKTWSYKPNIRHAFPTYPSLLLAADGRLFYTGSSQGYVPNIASTTPGIWNLKTNNFQIVPGLPNADRINNSTSILLPPAQDQRVMILGGAGNGDSPLTTNRTAIVDLDKSANPVYEKGPDLQNATRYPGVVVLPDDTVFETGGSSGYRTKNVLSSQIFHPDTNTFSKAASPIVGRNYHSEAILLPDGRVATFGSNPIDNTFEMRIEIYSPAYLFNGLQPKITGGNTELKRGAASEFTIGNATDIKTAKLVRPSSVTHVTDVEQRSVNLPFTSTPEGISVKIPDNQNLLPSGWYMAFVTNQQNIPSKAYWVHVQ